MSANFVPFLPRAEAAAKSPDNEGGKAPAFTPVSAPAAPAAATAAGKPHPSKEHEFKVELKRDGEKISQIFIQCHCGEQIQIDCEY